MNEGAADARPPRWLRLVRRRPWLARRRLRALRVSGGSMYPLLHAGDVVLFDRLAFRREPPRRGDLALVRHPGLPEPRLVKLVVGLPGERVATRQDRIWIDGRPLAFPQPVVGAMPGRWALGPDEYFLLSYAVAVGTDSRQFGPVPGVALVGRAWRIAAPAARRRMLGRLGLAPEPAR